MVASRIRSWLRAHPTVLFWLFLLSQALAEGTEVTTQGGASVFIGP